MFICAGIVVCEQIDGWYMGKALFYDGALLITLLLNMIVVILALSYK